MAEEWRDYVGISLWITSYELSPEKITETVGLNPTYVQVMGDPIRGVSRRYERHSWQLGDRFYPQPGDDVGKLTEKFFTAFLGKLNSATPRIKEISKDNSIAICMIYHLNEMPYIGLTSEQVAAIAAIGARVDHDVMIGGND